uniref:EF-hand domain-containing protein n=1 Tax=Chenopodium quinoa TaxID=63459 RepID=A0A803MUP6_CHEQI
MTATFVILILLPPSSISHNGNRHIRLFEFTHFDPLVTEIEHKAEDRNLDFHPNDHNHASLDYVYKVMEAGVEVEAIDKVYLGKDGKLNLTLRLTTLFPLIDIMPKDGYVEFRELEAWNIKQAKQGLEYSTRKEFEVNDKNKDGFICFKEIFPKFSDDDIEKNKMERGETGWWMEQFTNADADHDGKLSLEELNKRLDWDKDGNLNFQEFCDNAYDTFKNYYHFFTNGYVPSPELQFSNLDLDKD